jgi:pyruvate/2-oxoglutarate dehydrogenase complex dihydrolipoamide acyltransferase (E2) component
MSKIKLAWPLLAALVVSQGAIAQGFLNNVGGMLGGGFGGGRGDPTAALVAGVVSGLMSQILQSLTADEQQKRQQALQEAARSPTGATTGWTSSQLPQNGNVHASPANKPAAAKHATYVNKGVVADASGKKCTKILETITLPDGKAGTSEQLVCPS